MCYLFNKMLCSLINLNRIKCSYILIYLIYLTNFVYSTNNDNNNNIGKNIKTIEIFSEASRNAVQQQITNSSFMIEDKSNYVVTTPRLIISSTKIPSRYEQGLEDYEEAVARVEQTKESEKRDFTGGVGALYSLFSVLNSAWTKAGETEEKPRIIKEKNEYPTTEINLYDMDNVTDDSMEDYGGSFDEDDSDRFDAEKTDQNSSDTAVEEGRYIKGDPLKGYYDFIITEGSYKFWAGFQLFTALLMIYSTFAAIYYSKVNPIVSDYDYVSYLGGARSMASDPESTSDDDGSFHLSSLLNSHWLQTAAHGVEFVLESIDRIPQ